MMIPSLGFLLAAAFAFFMASEASASENYRKYVMDHDFFSCQIPAGWQLERDKAKDEEYRIYEIELIGPSSGKAPVSIRVSYYARDNEDFRDYRNFIERNSRNALGEKDNKREHYGPVKETRLSGRVAFELDREMMSYLSPQSKSDESVEIKERLYVFPSATGGFYVLHYSAPASGFEKSLPVFRNVISSFKGS
jgi:hypothetical protein